MRRIAQFRLFDVTDLFRALELYPECGPKTTAIPGFTAAAPWPKPRPRPDHSKQSPRRNGSSARPLQSVNRPAGLLDDRLKRCDVPEIHHRVDHHFGPACGDHHVSITVAPSASQSRRRLQPQISRPVALGDRAFSNDATSLVSSRPLVEPLDFRDVSRHRRLAAATDIPTTAANRGKRSLVRRRRMDDSQARIVPLEHGNQRRIQRHAVDKRLRSVDRIEHPLISRTNRERTRIPRRECRLPETRS